jgi:hypothetical protein
MLHHIHFISFVNYKGGARPRLSQALFLEGEEGPLHGDCALLKLHPRELAAATSLLRPIL